MRLFLYSLNRYRLIRHRGKNVPRHIVIRPQKQFLPSKGKVIPVASYLINILNYSLDPDPRTRHTIWSVVVGNYFFWLATCSSNQAMVQRCLSLPNVRKANMYVSYVLKYNREFDGSDNEVSNIYKCPEVGIPTCKDSNTAKG